MSDKILPLVVSCYDLLEWCMSLHQEMDDKSDLFFYIISSRFEKHKRTNIQKKTCIMTCIYYKMNTSSFLVYLCMYTMWRKSLFHVYLKRFQEFYFKYRTLPTMEECKEILGLSSKSSIHNFFQEMLGAGYLDKREWRYYPADRLSSIPFFESIQAWLPTPASDDLIDEISLEKYLVDTPLDTVFIKVVGESMIDAGIHEGDGIIVHKWAPHKYWDMVVAVVDGDFTVKFIQQDADGKAYLEPANENFSNIYPEWSMEIFGVVTGSFRKM